MCGFIETIGNGCPSVHNSQVKPTDCADSKQKDSKTWTSTLPTKWFNALKCYERFQVNLSVSLGQK